MADVEAHDAERDRKEEEERVKKEEAEKADAIVVAGKYQDATKDIKVPAGFVHMKNKWVRAGAPWEITEEGALLVRPGEQKLPDKTATPVQVEAFNKKQAEMQISTCA